MKHGTDIGWTHQPGYKGETWTVLAGCMMANYEGADGKQHGFRTCVGCYAMAQAASLPRRFGKINPKLVEKYGDLTKGPVSREVWNGNVYFDEAQLDWPLKCKLPRAFFLTSMGDLFYKAVDMTYIVRIVAIMRATPRHRYLVLTKRPDRMAAVLNNIEFNRLVADWAREQGLPQDANDNHIFWGTSIEDQPTADWAMSHLVNVPRKKWVSYEPVFSYAKIPHLSHLSWGVIGGASTQRGIKVETNVGDLRKIISDFGEAKRPIYVKQLGALPYRSTGRGVEFLTWPEMNNHNDDMDHWPEDLRVRQFPEAA